MNNYNSLGQKIQTIASSLLQPGYHEVSFNADRMSSGVYFLRVSVEGEMSVIKRIVLVK